MDILYSIRSFFRQTIMSYKALFAWLDPESYILIKVINPILQMTFFCLLAKYVYGVSDITPWVIGNSFLLCTTNVFFGIGYIMQDERNFGTLNAIILTPSNKFLFFLGRGFMHIIDSLFSVILGLIIGVLIFRVNLQNANIFYLLLAALSGMFAATSIGLLISSLGLLIRDLNLILNSFAMLFLGLTGANFPIATLPKIFRVISKILPLTRSIEAAKYIVRNTEITKATVLITKEFFIGFIYLILGYIALLAIQRFARIKATIDLF